MFQNSLLRWYGKHRRALPWRDNPTPYRVWISEIMLQQTQVKTVIPYFSRFLEQFPDLKSLADASERDVLALWSGLGYYSRARNLHRTARLIVERHGEFPEDFKDILALPGIGRYTAGAISSIAFSQAQPVVDGNIQRVVTRLKAIRKRPAAGHFWDQMSAWLPAGKSSAFNQAMMELGAIVCLPSQPLCPRCPVERHCEARRLGIQNEIPAVRLKRQIKRVSIAVLVLERNGKILLTSALRLPFIPGTWGLPCRQIRKSESSEDAAAGLCSEILGRTIPLRPASKTSHSISNRRIAAFGFLGTLDRAIQPPQGTDNFCWMSRHQESELLTSSLFRKILQKFRDMSTEKK